MAQLLNFLLTPFSSFSSPRRNKNISGIQVKKNALFSSRSEKQNKQDLVTQNRKKKFVWGPTGHFLLMLTRSQKITTQNRLWMLKYFKYHHHIYKFEYIYISPSLLPNMFQSTGFFLFKWWWLSDGVFWKVWPARISTSLFCFCLKPFFFSGRDRPRTIEPQNKRTGIEEMGLIVCVSIARWWAPMGGIELVV